MGIEIYNDIADCLAQEYEAIYYIDVETGAYCEFAPSEMYQSMEVPSMGKDFFEETRANARKYAHPDDREYAESMYYKELFLDKLYYKKSFTYKYRILINGDVHFFCFLVMMTKDKKHFVLCDKDISDEVRAERERQAALRAEREIARRDELTGAQNRTAYLELMDSVQGNIDNGMDYLPFSLAVCDINDLKKINDSRGHNAGDDYIKNAYEVLRFVFSKSPIFRVGGDEFVIFLRSDDYTNREMLVEKIKKLVRNNIISGEGAIIAVGMSDFRPGIDMSYTDVFERADNFMYEDKRSLKDL